MPATKIKAAQKRRKTVQKQLVPDEGILFLSDALQKMVAIRQHYNVQAEVILGLSGLIFIFSVANLFDSKEKGTIGFLFMTITGLASAIFSIFVLKPPVVMKRHDLSNTLMHHTALSRVSYPTFKRQLARIVKNRESIVDEYTREIYNISVNSIMLKKKFSRQAANILVFGLLIGFVLMIMLP